MNNKYNVPIYKSIKDYLSINPITFHMPGHKLGRGLPQEFIGDLASFDLTEIPGTDNLHHPTGTIKEAQQLAARAFGADSTYFLVNGSTCGIHAMIMTICKPGDRLIVARDCHKSVINGMLMTGVRPIYINPDIIEEFMIPGVISPERLEKLLAENPDVRGVLLTRPNYYGICLDIEKIAAIVHAYGKILAVDEAHGAHLRFSRQLPVCAMDSYADICVQSAHKTLPALTQGAYLHVKGERIDTERLAFNLSMLQTSSPSYILMACLDIARAIMEHEGAFLLERLLGRISVLEKRVEALTGIKLLNEEAVSGVQLDKTRMTINVRGLGRTGFDIDKMLRARYGIQVEMSDYSNIVLISTVSDEDEDFIALGNALAVFSEKLAGGIAIDDMKMKHLLKQVYSKIPPQELDFAEAMNCRSEKIELSDAVGRISRSIIMPYPPGIPLICPGEMINEETVEYIYNIIGSGGVVTGLGEKMEVSVVA